ncbi:MAG: DUF695 domain-containing protein [Mucilaginibacter polytrichastri]|nr:DUF695 domain-containing protein [Mucilaginibacter polytrichastri]
MKQPHFLFLISIITVTLFSCRQSGKSVRKSDFPEEQFSVVEITNGDKPAVGSFNMAYKRFDGRSAYPWCLKISIGLDENNVFENGLPKAEEGKIANQAEDELLSAIRKLTTVHYIGHLFNDSFLDVYVYLDDPEKVHKFLQTQINKEGLIRAFAYEISKDPTWAHMNGILR